MVVLLYHTAIVACAPLNPRPPALLAPSVQQGFWQQYKWTIILGGGLLAVEGLLIAALLRERRRRRSLSRSPAEAALIKSEEFNRRIVESTSDCVKVLDLDGNLIYINEQGQKLLEVSRIDALLGLSWVNLWDGEDRRHAKAALQNARNGATGSFRGSGKTFTGKLKWWHTVISPMYGAHGNVERILAVSRDMTEQELSLRAIEQSEQHRQLTEREYSTLERELMQLTVRLFDIQDQERRRIARELHDGTAQNLFAISMNLQKLFQLSSGNEEIQRLVLECQALDEQSLREIRTLSYLLHPPLLDQAGLVSALQWYVEGFSKRSGIFVEVFAEPIGRLQSEVEMTLFRVVQEALSNVRRHSESETASIRLARKDGEVVLQIKDQGRGLALADCSPDTNGALSLGVGIPGMKQRLRQLGGTLDITSNNGGTTVSAVVPIVNGVDYGTNTGG